MTLLLATLVAHQAAAGIIGPELDQILTSSSPSAQVPVFLLAVEPVNEDGAPFSVQSAVSALSGVERREEGVNALKRVANQVLPPIHQALVGAGCTHVGELDWLVTGIAAKCTPAVVRTIAARSDVDEIVHNGPKAAEIASFTPVSADLAHTRATAISGARGNDVTVGIVDTGVMLTDASLRSRVMCRDAPSCLTSVPNCQVPYWRDGLNVSTTPVDDHGHGTTMTQLAVGASGMAPDARWVACRGMAAAGNPDGFSAILRCVRFMLDPDNPDNPIPPVTKPECAPDVVVFPWQINEFSSHVCPTPGREFHRLVIALRGIGILPVFASGEDGLPRVGTPASFAEGLTVGGHVGGEPTVWNNFSEGVCRGDPGEFESVQPNGEGSFTTRSNAGAAVWHAVSINVPVISRPDFDTQLGTVAVGRNGTTAPPQTITIPIDGSASVPAQWIVVGVTTSSPSGVDPSPSVTAGGRTFAQYGTDSTVQGGRRYETSLYAIETTTTSPPLVEGNHIVVNLGTTGYDEGVVSAALYDSFDELAFTPTPTTAHGVNGLEVSTGMSPLGASPWYDLIITFVAGFAGSGDLGPGDLGYAARGGGIIVDQGLARSTNGSVTTGTALLTHQFRVAYGAGFRPTMFAPATVNGVPPPPDAGSDVAAAHVAGAAAILHSKFPDIEIERTKPDDSYLFDSILVEGGVRHEKNCTATNPCTPSLRYPFDSLLDIQAPFLNDMAEFDGWNLENLRYGLVAGDRTELETKIYYRNNGAKTWTPDTHRLVPRLGTAAAWGVAPIPLPVPEVKPGDRVEFVVRTRAPNTPNADPGYPFYWGLESTSGYLGPTIRTRASVSGIWKGQVSSPQIPTFALGSQSTFTVPTENVGTYTWTKPTISLREYPHPTGDPEEAECPPFVANRWGVTKVDLGNGEQVQSYLQCEVDRLCSKKNFPVNVTIPAVSGKYLFRFRLYQEGVGWLGNATSVHCVDTDGSPSFLEVAKSNPNEVRVGQSGSVTLTVRNTGNTVWNQVGGYCLQPSSDSSLSIGGSTCLAAGEQIHPYPTVGCEASEKTFNLTATPTQPGRWEISYRMRRLKGGIVTPFGMKAAIGSIAVPEDHQASAEFNQTLGNNSGDAASKFWSYRYYHWDENPQYRGWWKMSSWQAGEATWRGPGDDTGARRQKVSANRITPGITGAALFWKSPVSGRVRVTVNVADAEHHCAGGDGSGIMLKFRQHHHGSRSPVVNWAWTLPPGGTRSLSFELDVLKNDSLRFIVSPLYGSQKCDATIVDPLVQILPSAELSGALPPHGNVFTLNVELED